MSQELSIKGVKFFQQGLELLKLENERAPLPASALAVYMLFHFEVDDYGRVGAKNLTLSKFAEQTDIPYSTLHTGKEILFKRKLIQEVPFNKSSVYKITNYERWNTPELQHGEKLSYFRLPFNLNKGNILRKLVSNRDAKGIMLLLKLCNEFTRHIRRYKKSDAEVSFNRTMEYIKKEVKKPAVKVREFLDAIKEVFSFEAIDYKEKHPRTDRVGGRKKNNVVQIVVRSFKVILNPELIYKEPVTKLMSTVARMRKEFTSKLHMLKLDYSNKDIKDSILAYKKEVVQVLACTPLNVPEKVRACENIFIDAIDKTITYVTNKTEEIPGFKVDNLGGFMRKRLRDSLKHHLHIEMNEGERIDLLTLYQHKYKKNPPFLTS